MSSRRFEFHGTRSCGGSERLERFGAVDTGDYTEFTHNLWSSRPPRPVGGIID